MRKLKGFKSWQNISQHKQKEYRIPDDGELIGIPPDKTFYGYTRHSKMTMKHMEKKLLPVNIQSKFAPTGTFYSSRDAFAFEAGCKLRLCNAYPIEIAAKEQNLPYDDRLIFHPDTKLSRALDQAMSDIIETLRQRVTMKITWPTREKCHAWVEDRPYSSQEKERLHRCINEHYDNVKPLNLRYSMFMKKETYPTPKAARMICNCSKDIKWLFGTIQHELQDAFFDLPCTVKHIPVCDRLDYVKNRMQNHYHYYATDHTSFESSQTAALLQRTEWRLFREFCDEETADFMIDFYKRDHKFNSRYFRVQLPAMRSSGDVDTSFGNSVVNLSTFGAYCYYVNDAQNWMDRILVEGDDGLFYMNHKHNDYQQVLATMGLRVKLDYSTDWRSLEFLSMRFDSSGHRKMDIIRRASSLFVNINNKKLDDIFDMKIMSLFADFGIPWETEDFDAVIAVDNDHYHRQKYNVTNFKDHDPIIRVVMKMTHRDWNISKFAADKMKELFEKKQYVSMIETLIFASDMDVYSKWISMQQHTLSLCF